MTSGSYLESVFWGEGAGGGQLTKEAERTYIQFVALTGIIWRVRREILETILGEQTETRTDPGQLRGLVTFPPRFRGEAERSGTRRRRAPFP